MRWLHRWIFQRLVDWLRVDIVPLSHLYSNFDRLCFAIEPCDVLLLEGRSRVSQIIKLVTQSSWTHSAIYVGRLVDIEDQALYDRITAHYDGDPTEQLIVESLLGQGTIVAPLSKYEGEHLRICRPHGLSTSDQQAVLHYAVEQLGMPYDVRQLLDLARFFLPWSLMPRRWRSTLFEHHAGEATRHVCSSMMATAYSSVDFPILPFIERWPDGQMVFYKRNPRLFVPRDFDHSPYFDVIKFPYLDRGDVEAYRALEWSESGIVYNDEDDFLKLVERRRRARPGMTSKPEPATDDEGDDGDRGTEESLKESSDKREKTGDATQ
jgi:hypothetical protein